jgi:galactose-1-phosphate uridylyltransferase
MEAISFDSVRKETLLLNPLQDMAPRTIVSEIRRDPLTGRSARICHFMKLNWPKPDFEQLVAGTERNCPFCPQKVRQVTPCFPEELIPGGRLTAGDMVLFPNLAPYDSLSAVAVLGADHYLPMTAISAARMAAGFGLCVDFFRRLEQIGHPESVYHVVNWNYMPPSGSSIIHPHLQVFATSSPPNLMRQELAASAAYLARAGSNYWDDLVAREESAGRRFLGRLGRTGWLSAFAPMGVAGDVVAVVDGACCTLDLTADDLADIAEGLRRMMAAYDRMGIYSFNMNFFTGRSGDEHTRFHIVFSPRAFFNQALATPDVGALRNLFNESLCMAYPEEINDLLKVEFA